MTGDEQRRQEPPDGQDGRDRADHDVRRAEIHRERGQHRRLRRELETDEEEAEVRAQRRHVVAEMGADERFGFVDRQADLRSAARRVRRGAFSSFGVVSSGISSRFAR